MGKGLAGGDDFDVVDVELDTGGGAGIFADASGDDDGGFELEVFEGLKELGRDGGFGDDSLHGAGAVAEDREEQFAGCAEIVEPALEGDGLADVPCKGGDGGDGGCGDWVRHDSFEFTRAGCGCRKVGREPTGHSGCWATGDLPGSSGGCLFRHTAL